MAVQYQNLDFWMASPEQLLCGLASIAHNLSLKMSGEVDGTSPSRVDLQDTRRCLDGDGDAYARLVERYQGRVSAMMWRFSRDPETHEELVQDVFVEAYTSLSTWRAHAPFSHWLACIATRVGYRYWKRLAQERAHPTFPLEEWDQLAEAPPEEIEPSQAAELLYRLLERLPPRDRLVLTLRYIEEHSVEETARLTGWSKAMVKVQSWRAKRKLKKLFDNARAKLTE